MTKTFLLLLAAVFSIAVPVFCRKNEKSATSAVQKKTDTLPAPQNRQYIVKVGDTAPDFEMQLSSGGFMKLSDLRGKLVMLQFTASWCGVCRKEMPHIESKIWQKHKDNPAFALYGIDLDEPADTVAMFRQTTGVTYPIGLDPGGLIFNLYAEKGAGVTRNVIIDPQGTIIMLTRLYDEKEFAEMVTLIDSKLAGR